MSALSILGATADYSYSYSTSDPTAVAGMLAIIMPIYIIILAVAIVSLWKVFSKAGRPGWAALVPIYNVWVLLEVAGKPGWWSLAAIVVSLIPVVGSLAVLAVSLIVAIELAKKFGKSTTFGIVALWLFSLVGYAILAFGDAQYEAEEAAASQQTTPEIVATQEEVTTPSQDSTPPTTPVQ